MEDGKCIIITTWFKGDNYLSTTIFLFRINSKTNAGECLYIDDFIVKQWNGKARTFEQTSKYIKVENVLKNHFDSFMNRTMQYVCVFCIHIP